MSQDTNLLYVILLGVRIFITIYCVNKAKALNRSTAGWGIFGFLLPIVAIIWIQFMKPVMVWDRNPEMKIEYENVAQPHLKETRVYSSKFYFLLGINMVVLGVILVIANYLPNVGFEDLWPILLLSIGLGMIIKRRE